MFFYKICGSHTPTTYESERRPNVPGRVVKTCLAGDIGVVQGSCIQGNQSTLSAAAKKVYGASAANHVHCPNPRFGPAHGFNAYINTMAAGYAAYSGDGIRLLFKADNLVGAHVFRALELIGVFPYSNDASSPQ